MPSKVIFENAILADAVAKASRIAPTKGPAYDKAGGILFVVNKDQKQVSVRATDLECTFMQDIPCLEAQGDSVAWRIPSAVLSGITSQLGMGDNNSFTEFIDRGDNAIRLVAGKLVVRLQLLDAKEYPDIFEMFPVGDLAPAQQLSQRVEQVSWAVDPKSNVLSGVHVDGTKMIGCNQYLIATIPCEVELKEPVTVPLTTLTALLKTGSDVRCAASDKRFLISLDGETRATSSLIAGKYPNVSTVMREDFLSTLEIHRQSLVDSLTRLMVLIRQERLPKLTLEVNGTGLIKVLTLDMEVMDLGRMQDSIDVSSEYTDVFRIFFAPKMVLDAISNARSESIHIDFGHADADKSDMTSIRVRDTLGYVCYVMPKKPD